MADAVGGVDVCLATPIHDTDVSPALNLEAGNRTLRGAQAAAFLRSRLGVGDGSDLGRISNQQTFMSALARQTVSAGTLTNPAKVLRLANTAFQHMTLSDTRRIPRHSRGSQSPSTPLVCRTWCSCSTRSAKTPWIRTASSSPPTQPVSSTKHCSRISRLRSPMAARVRQQCRTRRRLAAARACRQRRRARLLPRRAALPRKRPDRPLPSSRSLCRGRTPPP